MMRAGWLTIPLALLLDAWLGDPPNRWHPVAWMGTMIAGLRHHAPQQGRGAQFLFGSGIAVGGALLWGVIGKGVVWALDRLPAPVAMLLTAAVLKTTLSLNGLVRAGREVERPLLYGEIAEARRMLSWHLVSRDTSGLDERQVAAATVESLAENASDGVIAPLFWYALLGLPGALAYRYLNTCDAMLGYRDAEREWLGKASARLDDLANLLPARITAAGIVLAAPVASGSVGNAFTIWRRDAHTTTSPNAGQPMAAAAGALAIELDKPDLYRLGAGGREASVHDIGRMIVLLRWAAMGGAAALTLVLWLRRKG